MTTHPRRDGATKWSGSRESANPDRIDAGSFLCGVVFGTRARCRMKIPYISCISLFSCTLRIFLSPFAVSLPLSPLFSLSLSITLLSTPFELPLEGHPLPRTACPRIRPGVAVSSRAASARASLAIVGPRVRKTGRFSLSTSSSRVDLASRSRKIAWSNAEVSSMFSCKWRDRGNHDTSRNVFDHSTIGDGSRDLEILWGVGRGSVNAEESSSYE